MTSSGPSSRPMGLSARRRTSRTLVTLALTLLALVALGSAPSSVSAQNVTQKSDDPITLVGTWSSGAGNVVTGLDFFNPGNNSFNIPVTSGQSYSFTEDGYWEQSLYLFLSNPGSPKQVQAQLIWQHGKFVQNRNGTITLWPFVGDGRQLIQSTTTAQTETTQSYDQEEFMSNFYIRLDTHYGKPAYMLQMFGFDGTPKPPLWQIYNPPQMLPTQQLKQQVIGGLNFGSP